MKKRSNSMHKTWPTAFCRHPVVDQDSCWSTRANPGVDQDSCWSTRTDPVVDQGPYLVDQSFTEFQFLVRFVPVCFPMLILIVPIPLLISCKLVHVSGYYS